MANEWYYTQNGQQSTEPISASQLRQLASEGKLKPTDLVWQQGMPSWKEASSVKGLFDSDKPVTSEMPVAAKESAAPSRSSSKPKAKPKPPVGSEGDSTSGGIMDMHPLLVLGLAIVTCGVFGLIYAFLVCRAYTDLAAHRTQDGAGRKLGKARHPIWVLLLAYLTFGYYFVYWVYMVMKECSAYTGRKDYNHRTEFCLMLLFPAYGVYVAVFRLPEMIRRTQGLAGVPETKGLAFTYMFLNPCMFFAMPYLAMIYQDSLNQVWFSAP